MSEPSERTMHTAPLDQLGEWPVGSAAGAVVERSGDVVAARRAADVPYEWASLTKVLTAVACWVAVEEGTLRWDLPAGPEGSTVAHLLAHASGLAPDAGTVLASPGTRRIYSNRGFEVAADVLGESSGMAATDYVVEGVIAPLGMSRTVPVAGPTGTVGPLDDLVALARELLRPTLVTPATWALATAVAFPGLDGVLPGFGRQTPNDWGLGVEVRGTKQPHWTAPAGSPRTFGHFGRQGGFLWVDPDAGLACCCLTDRPFGSWAVSAWPLLSAAVLDAYGA